MPGGKKSPGAVVDNNAANQGAISVAASRIAVRDIRTEEELTIARAASRTLGLNIASEEIHADQARKYIFRLILFSARGPPIDHGRFVPRIASAPSAQKKKGASTQIAMRLTFQTRCQRNANSEKIDEQQNNNEIPKESRRT